MADSCANCFFFRVAPASAGPAAGRFHCRAPLPQHVIPNDPNLPWVEVQPDWWCGDGADATSGISFAALANMPPGGARSTGTIDMPNAFAISIINALCTSTSVIRVWLISYGGATPPGPPAMITQPANGSFIMRTADNSQTTGTWGYAIY